jgi:hypothetical protein
MIGLSKKRFRFYSLVINRESRVERYEELILEIVESIKIRIIQGNVFRTKVTKKDNRTKSQDRLITHK